MLASTPLRQRSRWLSGVEATVGGTNGNLLYTRPGHRVPPGNCTTTVMSHHGTLHSGLGGCGTNENLLL